MEKSKTRVFVFGANEAGIHGAGSANAARLKHGAIIGQGDGRQGNSYGICTKDGHMHSLPLDRIAENVTRFVAYATEHPDEIFDVVRVGCGRAGYTDERIAPMFKGAPQNVRLPAGWRLLCTKDGMGRKGTV